MSLPFEILTVYVAYTTTDERGTLGPVVAISESRNAAEQFAEGKGWWGGKGTVLLKKAIRVNAEDEVMLLESESAYPLNVDIPQRNKEQVAAARAKLTDEEARLLGID